MKDDNEKKEKELYETRRSCLKPLVFVLLILGFLALNTFASDVDWVFPNIYHCGQQYLQDCPLVHRMCPKTSISANEICYSGINKYGFCVTPTQKKPNTLLEKEMKADTLPKFG